MADRKVYVVLGEHSEYDNNSTWVDSVWSSRKAADDHAWSLNKREQRRQIRNREGYEVIEVTLNTERSKEGGW